MVDNSPIGRTGASGPAGALPAGGGCRRRLSGRRAPAAARLLRRSALAEEEAALVAGSEEDELFLPLSKGLRVMRDVSSVTALKGKSVSLVCPLYVAAWASVSWEKGSNKIPFNHRQRVQPDGSLSISNVQQVSDDGNYVCRFTDSRNQKHTGNVLLKVIEPPVISHYEFRKDMQVGMRIKVFCTVVQGDPPFLFTWLKDGVPVVENGAPSSQAAINVHNERDYSMLSTDSLQLEHSGNYTCVVKNQAATTAYSAVLRVNEPPKWDVEPESAAVVQGRNVQLQCSASGTPQPIITWMIASDSTREEFLPLYNSHKYGLFPNGTLSIHQLEPEESGYYLCKASNGFGEDLSKLVFLTVKRPPKFDVKFRAHAVKRGEKARLQCTAMGDLPIAMTWSKNNDRVPEKSKYKVSTVANQSLSSVSSTLVVSTETVEDSGIYSCFAKNHYGSDETSMRLLVQEVPGPPVNVTVANATGNSLFLTWGEPFRGNSAITRYLVQFREAGSDDEAALRNITTNSSLTSATIGPLRPARVFSLRVKAENGIGWGRFSNWVTANTEEHSPASPPLNITARPTGPNSIKISWEPPKEEDWNGHLKGYYITYRPAGSNEQHYHKTVEVHNPHQRQEIHLTNLRLSMSYSVAIQAFTGKGTGPMSREVLVKTLDDVPPSPPTLEVVSVSTSSVTLGWSLKTSFGNPVTEYVLHQRKEADHWQETPISTMQPVYTVRDLECGTTYQFYMTAHNSLGRSEPSDVIRAKTDGAAPLSPTKEEFIQASQRHASLSLRSWKSGGCELLDFTVKLRQGAAQAWTTVAEGLPANQTQLLLRNLTPGATYHVHVVARSTAGATEAQYEFTTPNGTAHVASVEATSSQPKRSSLPSMTDLEILVPILVSSCVVLIVIVVGCILCSRESLCADRHCGRPDLRTAYSEEVVDMKDLANTAECMARCEDGMHHSASQMNSRFPPAGQSIYAQRPVVETEDDRHPYAMPYDVLHGGAAGGGGGGGAAEGAEAQDGSGADGAGCQNHLDGRSTLKRRSDLKDHRSNNIYISRQSLSRTKPRDRPYESLMVNMNPYPADGTTTSTLSRKDQEDIQV
ncbi:Down syndrome cell adhesion molecule homolog [Dermacentor silvarum]|uniref:Down syndrome cell adhesion molecule homolog n=1 Tax=Dermacentor silvarum TaxID=543639 RepID=UPI001897ECAA|nr:Down syndrome cell adhesion molecule homolog [Dermacentor silvarum]